MGAERGVDLVVSPATLLSMTRGILVHHPFSSFCGFVRGLSAIVAAFVLSMVDIGDDVLSGSPIMVLIRGVGMSTI